MHILSVEIDRMRRRLGAVAAAVAEHLERANMCKSQTMVRGL